MELLSASRPSSLAGELTTHEVAEQLGRSLAWVKRHARELGGRLIDGAYQFPTVAIERRRTTTERITLGGGPSQLGREQVEGERDARVVAALENGRTVAQIVVAERVPIETVLRLRTTWLQGHAADRQGVSHPCGACGAPSSDPHFARCDRCVAKTRTLSEDQLAALAGRPSPAPETCPCTGCGRPYSSEHLDHVCLGCRDRIAVVVDGARVHVVLRATTGPVIVLRTLSVEESQRLSAALTPPVTPRAHE